MKKIYLVQTIVLLAAMPVIVAAFGPKASVGFGCGALTILALYFLNDWGFAPLFRKKRSVLSVTLIVLKYPILMGLIYFFVVKQGLNLAWFSAGLATILVSSLAPFVALSRKVQ